MVLLSGETLRPSHNGIEAAEMFRSRPLFRFILSITRQCLTLDIKCCRCVGFENRKQPPQLRPELVLGSTKDQQHHLIDERGII